jgi:hypothetical protein
MNAKGAGERAVGKKQGPGPMNGIEKVMSSDDLYVGYIVNLVLNYGPYYSRLKHL